MRRPKYRTLATFAVLSISVLIYVAIDREDPLPQAALPYPDGMDANGNGFISLREWTRFHSTRPQFYGGIDQKGPIPRDSDDYYEREFRRVDCDRDSKIDAHEYDELRWNARWCESPFRPNRPWSR